MLGELLQDANSFSTGSVCQRRSSVLKAVRASERGGCGAEGRISKGGMVSDESCAELMRWAASKGITDAPRDSPTNLDGLGHSLVVANFPDAGGRGLAASRGLKEGELILRISRSAMMSVWSAKADPLLSTALARYPVLSSTQILTLHLLNEAAKGKSSIWFPYLVCLPRVYHTLPYFMKGEIQALQVAEARWLAENAVEKAISDWEGAKVFMEEINLRRHFRSLKAWLWASATVSTRTLHVPWDEAGTLCPVGDLFNYAAPGAYDCDSKQITDVRSTSETNEDIEGTGSGRDYPEGRKQNAEENMESEFDDDISCNGVAIRERLRDGGFEDDRGEYCFYARQGYDKGQQVLLCYGLYNNLELLEHYGFLLPHNPNDNIHISLPDSGEFFLGSGNPSMHVGGATCLEVSGSPSFSLVAGLRLRACHPSMRKAKGHLALMGKQISVESDILIFQWLEKKCKSLVASLPTTLDCDLSLRKVISSVQTLDELEDLAISLHESLAEANAATLQESTMHEVDEFLRVCNSVDEVGTVDVERCGVRGRDLQLERWKLALDWRTGYKQILHRCIHFCARKFMLLKQ